MTWPMVLIFLVLIASVWSTHSLVEQLRAEIQGLHGQLESMSASIIRLETSMDAIWTSVHQRY